MKKGEASGVPMWVITLIITMIIILVVLLIVKASGGSLFGSWDRVSGTVSGSGLTG